MPLPTEPAIRWAVPADIPELVRLCAEHAAFEYADYDPAGKAERLAQHLFGPQPRARCLVVDGDRPGHLLGYASFTEEFSTWDAAPYTHVDCLYLRPGGRNRHLGWQMGKRIAAEALASGSQGIQFQTPPFNRPAIRLYEAMGARRKEKVRFYGNADEMRRFVAARGPAGPADSEAMRPALQPAAA